MVELYPAYYYFERSAYMKAKGIFLLFILSSIVLVLIYLYIFTKPLYLTQLEKERISNIQKVCMKEYPRNRAKVTINRNVAEAKEKIYRLLKKTPIAFDIARVSIDNNSTHPNKNKVILKELIIVLNNIKEDFILSIFAYTDKDGSRQKNLKLSQERADRIKAYIEKRTDITLITSIGYGEELTFPKSTKKLTNSHIEINLKRIKR